MLLEIEIHWKPAIVAHSIMRKGREEHRQI